MSDPDSWRKETVPRGEKVVFDVTGHYPSDLKKIDELQARVVELERVLRDYHVPKAELEKANQDALNKLSELQEHRERVLAKAIKPHQKIIDLEQRKKL